MFMLFRLAQLVSPSVQMQYTPESYPYANIYPLTINIAKIDRKSLKNAEQINFYLNI